MGVLTGVIGDLRAMGGRARRPSGKACVIEREIWGNPAELGCSPAAISPLGV